MPLAVDFQGGVTSAWSNVITFVPKLAAALVIILVGYLLARVVAGVLNKVLERVGFDRAGPARPPSPDQRGDPDCSPRRKAFAIAMRDRLPAIALPPNSADDCIPS